MQAGASRSLIKEKRARRFTFNRRRVIILFALALLAVAAGVLWLLLRSSYTERAMSALVSEFGKQRPVEGRLTGGFKGGRFVSPPADYATHAPQKIIDASRLLDEAERRNEPGARLAYARLLLLANEKKPVTLKVFRQLLEAEPSGATWNDFGVCLLASGQLEDALAAFDKALQQQPNMPEALFNRALSFEQLQLRDAASTDFARLLEIDRDPSWRGEIREHLQSVSAPIPDLPAVDGPFEQAFTAEDWAEAARLIDNNTYPICKYANDNCLCDYLKAAAHGKTEISGHELAKIKYIGQRLADTLADHSLLDLAAYAERLSPAEAAIEISLIQEYEEIEAHPLARPATESEGVLQKLSGKFRERGNHVYELFATFQAANCYFYQGQYGKAMALTRDALNIAQSHAWAIQRVLVLTQLGNICSRTGRDSFALNYCRTANDEAQGRAYAQSKTMQYMANACWHLGNVSQGLQYLRESSRLFLSEVPSGSNFANNTLQAAEFYRLTNRHDLALSYARQAFHYAEIKKSWTTMAQASSFIAVELAQHKEFDASNEEMRRAFAMIEKIPKDRRFYSQQLVLLRAGDLAAQQNRLEEAEMYYAQAQRIAESGEEQPLPLIKVLKARAASYARFGRAEEARADLERACALIEEYRSRISEQNNRSDFFDASQDVFDQKIQLEAHAFKQWVAAFNTSEQARTRTLLDDLATTGADGAQTRSTSPNAARHSATALSLDDIRRELPAGLTLISYSVSHTGTLIFVVTRDAFTFADSEATTEDLDQLVQEYLNALRERAPVTELAQRSRRLYELLIDPIKAKLGAGALLCIAPDKALHLLPFSALIDPAGHYLMESHILTSEPSASTLAYCLKMARRKGLVADEKMLAVGNPRFSRDDYPNLPPLPEAEQEAITSAALYNKLSVVLTGANATKARLLDELVNCDVAHLSMHCVIEEKTPWLAKLVLAKTTAGKDADVLRLNEFEKIGLLRARLVILSACQSALGQYYRGEGIVSLVRPFLARGVPTVVASLWPVDSRATAKLMTDFHRARKKNGLLAAEALRTAQLQMLQNASFNHPYYWAPFVVIGSSN